MPAVAARLGGAYYVDDAEIGKTGSCEFESWSSFAANGDRIAVFSPACVVKLGPPVELGTNLLNVRSDSQEDFFPEGARTDAVGPLMDRDGNRRPERSDQCARPE